MGDTVAALAIGVGGAVGLYLLWKRASAAPVDLAPAPQPSLPSTVRGILESTILNPNRTNHAIFGSGVDAPQFQPFSGQTAAMRLGLAMCACYEGGAVACATAQQQAPGLHCKRGDCDCHIKDTSGRDIGTRDVQEIMYRDSHGTYRTAVGPKMPAGGCRTNMTAAEIARLGFSPAEAARAAEQMNQAARANISGGFCQGIA